MSYEQGIKFQALSDMGIRPDEVKYKFDIPNQIFLDGTEIFECENMDFLNEWGLEDVQ